MGGYGYGYPNGGETPAPSTPSSPSDQGDQAGQQLWQELKNKSVTCDRLTQDDFAKLGDYFMGQMMGSAHDSMDQLMTQRLGENGDQQMHVAVGERLSGCNSNAALPVGGNGFWSMMGDWNNSQGNRGGYPMMFGAANWNPATGVERAIISLFFLAGAVDLGLGGLLLIKKLRK